MPSNRLVNIKLSASKLILELIYKSQKGHIGGSLSILDFFVVLFFGNFIKEVHKKNFVLDDNFILSKGHCALTLYVIYYLKGFISKKKLFSFNKNNSKFGEHQDTRLKGVLFEGGSLGHGVGQAIGVVINKHNLKIRKKTYVILGDGEISEGSIWESFLFIKANTNLLGNLVIVIDFNKSMTLKTTSDYLNYKTLTGFFQKKALILNVDGHDLKSIETIMKKIKKVYTPTILFLNTIKGKGIDFMEKEKWHHKVPNKAQYEIAMSQLNEK